VLSASEPSDFRLLDPVFMNIEDGHFVHISNIKARSHNQCYRGKSKKYYIFQVCVCGFSYPACKAHASHYIVICGLSVSTVYFHIVS